ncbi:endonuclease-reverse transcriptase [Elysia marginata]|uniref:Endonuclease-reverse transcriptase n=1 Tax=Elysia marginata TaxID=1093978 RepID=A0AAV4H1V1_9GAST|nr:endonuclease-reverse transcriptase [Elysia marginata]
MSEAVKIKHGVRQGCAMSPAIFNLYNEYIFRTIDNIPGLSVGCININNLRYADGTVMLAENEDDLQKLVNIVKKESETCGLFINIRKTKTMVISREKVIPQIDIKIDGERVEHVANFTYLGHWITEDGRSDQEVKRRIGMAKNTFSRMSKQLTNRRTSFATRSRLTKCYVWSIFLHACETCTLNASLERNIEVLEMWLYRRMARISWKEKKNNKEVLEEIGLKHTELMKTTKTRQLAYYGHIRRHQSLQKSIMEGKINGKRQRGRKRKSWLGNIEETTTRRINECCEVALDREEWRRTIASNLWQETEQR